MTSFCSPKRCRRHQPRCRHRQRRQPRRTSAAPTFTGRGSEYFRIWVVNVLLTLVTFGVYSAWAKVRKARY